jgi:hypothetical protein
MMLVLGVSTLGMVPYVAIALSQFSVRSLVLVLVVVVCGVWLHSTYFLHVSQLRLAILDGFRDIAT